MVPDSLVTDIIEVACYDVSVTRHFFAQVFLVQIKPQPLLEEFVLSPDEPEEIEFLAEPRTRTIS